VEDTFSLIHGKNGRRSHSGATSDVSRRETRVESPGQTPAGRLKTGNKGRSDVESI
jgi:hypothetical protein